MEVGRRGLEETKEETSAGKQLTDYRHDWVSGGSWNALVVQGLESGMERMYEADSKMTITVLIL